MVRGRTIVTMVGKKAAKTLMDVCTMVTGETVYYRQKGNKFWFKVPLNDEDLLKIIMDEPLLRKGVRNIQFVGGISI